MANVAANVIVGKPLATGGILVGPLGSALPADATTAPDDAFKGVGYAGEDGVTMAVATDVQEIKAWGGDTVRKIQTSHDVSFRFRLIESNDASLKAYYGKDNVTTTGGATVVKINAAELGHDVWLIEIKDGANRIRVVIPDGQITERGDVQFQDSDVIGHEVTLTAYPDESGNKAYLYKAAA